jgi:hypothetical protein
VAFAGGFHGDTFSFLFGKASQLKVGSTKLSLRPLSDIGPVEVVNELPRRKYSQNETKQPDHSASVGDSITSSTRMKFSVHTGRNSRE